MTDIMGFRIRLHFIYINIFIFMCVCLLVCVPVSACALGTWKRVLEQVTGSCELSDVSARNWTVQEQEELLTTEPSLHCPCYTRLFPYLVLAGVSLGRNWSNKIYILTWQRGNQNLNMRGFNCL